VKVLVVEDDEKLADVLLRGLREQQIETARASTFAEGRERLLFGMYDVIVLDVNLPGGSGMELCRLARARGITTPILILTARDSLDDRVDGLETGADDYMTKPFAFRELSARIHALDRRQPAMKPATHAIADLTVDLRARSVRRAGRDIQLTSKEFALLEVFLLHQDEVIDRAVITAKVWDENHDPFSKVVEVLINRLRNKIDEGFERRLIHTMRGAGYRFGL
jgi:DNA-binding response OmpR family regulator